jgi:hypothetical protein
MANTLAAFGMKPVRFRNGTTWNGQATPYFIPAADTNNYFIGDPVTEKGGSAHGNASAVSQLVGDFVVGSLMQVTIATAGSGNRILGPIVSVAAVDRGSTVYRAASVDTVVWVADDYNLIFQIQAEVTAVLTAAATPGLNAVLVSGTGSTTTGLSGWSMDSGVSAAPASNAAYQLTVLRVSNIFNNDITATNATWDVMINLSNLAPGVAGVS